MRRALPALLLPLALLVACCVGTGDGVPWVDPEDDKLDSFEDIQLQVFDLSGGIGSGCHAGGSPAQGLSLEAGLAIPNLVDVASSEVPELLRVAPGLPEESYLVVKIRPDDPRRVGVQMPRVGRKLNPIQIRSIERWIAAGATEDWVDEGPIDPVVVDDDDSGADDDDSAWDDDDSAWDDDDSGDSQ